MSDIHTALIDKRARPGSFEEKGEFENARGLGILRGQMDSPHESPRSIRHIEITKGIAEHGTFVEGNRVTPTVSDKRKLRATILAVAAVALLFIGFIGGLILGLVLRFAKNSDGEKSLWKGFKYQAGMFFNIKDMKVKDLRECGLVNTTQNNARLQDDVNNKDLPGQWANTVATVDVGEGIGATSHSLVLSAQLTTAQLKQFAEISSAPITIIASVEKWELKNEDGLKQFAEGSDYVSGTYHDVPVQIGIYRDEDGSVITSNGLPNGVPIRQILINLPDHTAISAARLSGLADIVNDEIQAGHVDVHCKSGRGRSAQIEVAYLMKHQHLSVEEAVNQVSGARRFADVKKAKLKALFYHFAFTELQRSTIDSQDAKNLKALNKGKDVDQLVKVANKIDKETGEAQYPSVSAALTDNVYIVRMNKPATFESQHGDNGINFFTLGKPRPKLMTRAETIALANSDGYVVNDLDIHGYASSDDNESIYGLHEGSLTGVANNPRFPNIN